MSGIVDMRQPLAIFIEASTAVDFEPVQGASGKYRSRDQLTVAQIVSLIASCGELKHKPLHISGCCPVVNMETAVVLAEIADKNAHSIPQPPCAELDKPWKIVAIPFSPESKEDYCRFGLEVKL